MLNAQFSMFNSNTQNVPTAHWGLGASVLNGDAGNPSLLYKFGLTGLSAQAYRTCFGF